MERGSIQVPGEIAFMDEVFDYLIDFYIRKTQTESPTTFFLANHFLVDKAACQLALNRICIFGKKMEILEFQKFGYGNYAILKMDAKKCLGLKAKGGFKSVL